jgi:fermentation-respiration switch protein FrsA (DUF1100 family)
MANKYWVIKHTGNGFYTYQDRSDMPVFQGHPGDLWITSDNTKATAWAGKYPNVSKTKAQAQAIVDVEVEEAQEIWDNKSNPKQALDRPIKYTLD